MFNQVLKALKKLLQIHKSNEGLCGGGVWLCQDRLVKLPMWMIFFLERCALQSIFWLLVMYWPRGSDPEFVLRRAKVMGTAVVLGAIYLAFNSSS